MARAGINKHAVDKARNLLISRGTNPSIDAIRVELGNTGSKTTISRYVKELEQEETVQLDDEALLSEGVKTLISQLASKLHQDANSLIESSLTKHQEQIHSLQSSNVALKEQLEDSKQQLNAAIEAARTKDEKLSLLASENSQSKEVNHSNHARIQELKAIIEEKDKQLEALKENHQHTRDNLEHYRVSIKEQREIERSQHEQQIQGLQADVQKLNQTLIVKQDDITKLNKDNSRLVAELGAVQKQCRDLESNASQSLQKLQLLARTQHDLDAVLQKLAEFESLCSELTGLNNNKDKALVKKELDVVRLSTELSVKDKLISQFSTK